ncbi:hypothetical protein H0W80_02270 [Candidatus Saccharibacteria bacterium]|nr:hypothetical protein [Candidatus Saccharibacteria bacterium]
MVEQLYFSGIEVGPTVYKILKACKRRFYRFDISSDREGSTKFKNTDEYGFAHMPYLAVDWVIDHQSQATILQIISELCSMNFTYQQREVHTGEYSFRTGLEDYLSHCLEVLLWQDSEVELSAYLRHAMINGGSLGDYGCNGSRIRRVQKMQITRLSTEEPCQGRAIGVCTNHDCSRLALYRFGISKTKDYPLCSLCFRWVFNED